MTLILVLFDLVDLPLIAFCDLAHNQITFGFPRGLAHNPLLSFHLNPGRPPLSITVTAK